MLTSWSHATIASASPSDGNALARNGVEHGHGTPNPGSEDATPVPEIRQPEGPRSQVRIEAAGHNEVKRLQLRRVASRPPRPPTLRRRRVPPRLPTPGPAAVEGRALLTGTGIPEDKQLGAGAYRAEGKQSWAGERWVPRASPLASGHRFATYPAP